MKRVRVAHVSVGLQWGGVETLVSEIVTRLDPARFDSCVVGLRGDGPVGDLLRKKGVVVEVLGSAGRWDPRPFWSLKTFFDRWSPDVIHSHLPRANFLASAAKGRRRLVWHEHCMDDWMGPWVKRVERVLIRRGDLVLAGSHALARRLEKRVPAGGPRIRVLPNGVDTGRFRPRSPEERARLRREAWGWGAEVPVIGYVGRLEELFKGLSVLIRSLSRLRRVRPDARVVLVGAGGDRGFLEDLARREGVADILVFAGERESLDDIFPTMDVLVLPSRSEGSSVVLLEAMACGLPVVATAVGGTPEIVVPGRTGLLVPPERPDLLAEALVEMLRDAPSAGFGAAGRRRVEELFSLEKLVSTLEGVYTGLAGGGRP